MIWNWIRLYLLIGACVIAFEWALLIIAKEGVLYESNMEPATKAACAVAVFIAEVVIWPRQLFVMVCCLYKALTGKLSNEELMEISLRKKNESIKEE